MSEAKAIAETLAKEWNTFKAENDRSAAKRDRETQEKLDRHSAAVGDAQKELKATLEKEAQERKELQAQVDELQKKMQRKGGGDVDPAKAEKEARLAEHRKAFAEYARTGDDSALTEFRAASSVDSDVDGGFTVPETLDREIIQIERDNHPMRDLCAQMQVSNENYEQLVNRGGASSGWVDEREARAETNTPVLAALKPYFGEVYANPAATQKLLDDSAFDIESWLAGEVGIEFGEQENDAFTNGNGVKKPKGILGYTLVATADGARAFGEIEKVHTGSAGAFVADKIIDCVYKLKRGYRQGATFMVHSLGTAAIRKLKDGQNNYLWQPAYTVDAPQMLLGYPLVENDDMPAPANDVAGAIFANFKRFYKVVDVRGTRVLRDPFTAKPKILFYTTKRVGGFVMNDRAGKVLMLSV